MLSPRLPDGYGGRRVSEQKAREEMCYYPSATRTCQTNALICVGLRGIR